MAEFLHKDDMYTAEFSGNTTLRIGEYDVVLPDPPDEKYMFNYDLARKKRKYQPTRVPKDIMYWKQYERDEYIASMWHRRLNGEWWIIKDEPMYFPGGATMFFDFWTTENGVRPDFRNGALELFTLWYLYVEKHKNVFGLYNVKPRRVGDTENFLFLMYESCTRFKHVRGGMQSYTDDEGQANFTRLVNGFNSMPFFFKPNHYGKAINDLDFRMPKEQMTLEKIRKNTKSQNLDPDSFLGSYINYEATVTGKYDGQRLFRYFLDEIFKIKPHMLNVRKQWNNIRRVTSLNNEKRIVGKSMLSSTVEKMDSKSGAASTLEFAEWLWDGSNPNELGPDGRTSTGLIRIFRNYEYAAEVDEWGFHKAAEAKVFRDQKLSKYIAEGDYEQVIDIYRKEPETIDEALSGSSEDCPLYPELCHTRLRQLKEGLDQFNNLIPDYRPTCIEGNLTWKNGKINSEVVFIPQRNGRWHISQMPKIPNNVSIREVVARDAMGRPETFMTFYPQNAAFYRGGCDPYDHKYILGKGSKGGIAVKRRWYLPDEDPSIELDEQGLVVDPSKMITNRYVCDYQARPTDPEMMYMDVVLTCWFYGMPILIEMDRPGLATWMRRNGYYGFMQKEPPLVSTLRKRNNRPVGVRSLGDIVAMYTERLQMYIAKYWTAVDHPRILKDWSKFKEDQRTKFDLSVATGLAELGDIDNTYKLPSDEEKSGWSHSPYNYRTG